MKHQIFFLSVFLFIVPLSAFAHASPVAYTPEEGSANGAFPSEIAIRFSERLEAAASSMKLFPPQGGEVPLPVTVNERDPRRLVARFDAMMFYRPDGIYAVSWQVVSADDGHFTKGAFQFSVGTTTAPAAMQTSVEVVHSSGYVEAAAIFMKLVGESMIVGLLALLALLARRRVFLGDVAALARAYADRFLFSAIGILGAGGVLYFIVKTFALQDAQGIDFFAALKKFAVTTAGEMTIALLALLAVFFAAARGIVRQLVAGERLFVRHWFSLFALVCISYTQARLSHAAASHILPTFSVFMNIPHLLGKGLWVGGALALAFVLLPAAKRVETSFRAAIRREYGHIVALATFLGGVSGAWIVWLHLKSFDHVFATPWGGVLVTLLAFAALLAALRLLSLLFFERVPRCLDCERPFLTLEGLTGLAVSFFSALIIITTPPLAYAPLYTAMSSDRGAMIHLSDPGVGRRELLLEGFDRRGMPVKNARATVVLTNPAEGIGPVVIVPRGEEGKWEIPASALSPAGKWEVRATLSPPGAYDINGRFMLEYPGDIERARAIASRPSWNGFARAMLLAGIAMILLSAVFVLLARRNDAYAASHPEIFSPPESIGFWKGQAIAVLAFLLLAAAVWVVRAELTAPAADHAAMHHKAHRM